MIIYKDSLENLIFLVFRLNPEIERLKNNNEIYVDLVNKQIEMTQNAFEKIMYYLGQKEQENDWYRKVKERMQNTRAENEVKIR
jgi:ribosomal protein L11 methylase PrmA